MLARPGRQVFHESRHWLCRRHVDCPADALGTQYRLMPDLTHQRLHLGAEFDGNEDGQQPDLQTQLQPAFQVYVATSRSLRYVRGATMGERSSAPRRTASSVAGSMDMNASTHCGQNCVPRHASTSCRASSMDIARL